MKKVKTFEGYWEAERERRRKRQEDQKDLARELLDENPMFEENDLYMFVGRDDFREDKDGRYTKTLEIENMVKVEPETANQTGWGLNMRAQIQGGKVYHIWLPKELEDMVSGKGSNSLDDWLVNLINQHKQSASDIKGQKLDVEKRLKDIRDRKNDMDKYNL